MAEELIPIILFLSVAVVLIIYRKFTNEERLAMIEKGVDANLFNRKINHRGTALKFGLLFIGAGIGLLLGSLLAAGHYIEEDPAYFSMLLLFGGLGLFVSYKIEKKEDKEGS